MDMLHTEEKLERRIREVLQYRYRNMQHLGPFRVREDASGVPNPEPPVFGDKDQEMTPGERWTGWDRYLWLERKVLLPTQWADAPEGEQVGVFDFGTTGNGNNSGFESMLYIDGKPWQAVDSNHREVFFCREFCGRELTLTFRLWSGMEGGGTPKERVHEYRCAFLGLLDGPSDDLYYLADMMLGTVRILPSNAPERFDLLRVLDGAFLRIDWTEPGSDAYYASVKAADDYLNRCVDAMEKNTPVQISCVGHTHIDTAWLWRLKHTREKVSRSFATVLRLMERFPEYTFLHTQPQQYAYIKEDFPELYEQIRQRVREGRWEIDGGMWVEADCNLTSGESLVRQFLVGRKFMLEEFGREPEYLWLPDVFGYSWALPQILKKSGIHTFMTTKISWNQYNQMPNDTFWWKGIDGSKVLTYFITAPEPGQPKEAFYSTYVGKLTPEVVSRTWDKYQDKYLNRELMLSYGFGDGGGGVNRDMLERRRRMDKLPGLPHLKTSRADDFFRRLHETVSHTDQPMATWDGEMYLEYHRGTYTSQGYSKMMNRRMEELYRKAEWMSVMTGLICGDLRQADQERLTEGWKIVLTHQFHDIIPGSSIRQVYEDSVVNYRQAKEIAEGVIHDYYDRALGSAPGTVSIINAFAEDRAGFVWLDSSQLPENGTLVTEAGEPVALQRERDGAWLYVENVPAMGTLRLHPVQQAEPETDAACALLAETELHELQITTPYYILCLTPTGQIASLYDREHDCQVLEPGKRGNVLQLFEDKSLEYDAWDIDMYYYQKMVEITQLTQRRVVENGPLRTVIRQCWTYHKSEITQDMVLYAKDRRIDFVTHVEWQETNKLLKTAFPVDIRAAAATYEIQFGNVKRANNSNTSWERARFESVAHRWVDLSEHNYGVSLLNNCKYGHDVHDNVIRLSLLKAATYPDYAADKGSHDFTYALLPHKGDFVEGGVVPAAFDLNQPMEALAGRLAMPTAAGDSLVRLCGGHVELDALKRSEDGTAVVLRFHEYAGEKCCVTVRTGFPVRDYAESDLMERPIEEFHSGDIQLRLRPYEIKTILLRI